MSFMPNTGSIVRLRNGSYGIVVAVTPKGDGDKVVLLGWATNPHANYETIPGLSGDWKAHEIVEVIYEPNRQDT